MLELRPFRVLEFLGEPDELETLLAPERKPDDRSQFVRFARIAAQLAEWDRTQKTRRSVKQESPVVDGFRYGVALLDELKATQNVVLAKYAEPQRLLEATQIYFAPIVVLENGSVVGSHAQFSAAKAFQAEMARPGKVRSSDFALVAIAPFSAEEIGGFEVERLNSGELAEFDSFTLPNVPQFGVKMWSLKDF